MAEVRLPLSIVYETQGATPVSDIIVALQATDALTKDAVSLLPSLFDGMVIEESSLNVLSLTQESPLRELFLISVFLSFQEDLEREVPESLEQIFNVSVSDKYDTLVTVAVLAIAFYGAGIAIDAARKLFTDSLPRRKFEELVQVLATETGKPAADIRSIIEAKFSKPAPAKRLASFAKDLFRPSQREQNAPAVFDRDKISSELIRQIPYPGESDDDSDFERYQPHGGVELEIHAQDKDRSATGWAAIAKGVSEKLLKTRVMDPVKPEDIWGKDNIIADIVVVSKMTSEGYVPAEIQITHIAPETQGDVDAKPKASPEREN